MTRHSKAAPTSASGALDFSGHQTLHDTDDSEDNEDSNDKQGDYSTGTWLVCENDHADLIEDCIETPAYYCPECGSRRSIERQDHEAIAEQF